MRNTRGMQRQPVRRTPGRPNGRGTGFDHPSLKAGLILFLPMVFIHWGNLLVLHFSLLVVYVIEAALYLMAGYLAARFLNYRQRDPRHRNYNPKTQYGAGAGAVLWVLSWVFFALMAILFGSSIYEDQAVLQGVVMIFWGLFDFIAALSLGALGSRLYQ